MNKVRTLIKVPAQAKAGDIIEISTLIGHAMETGLRTDAEGRRVPRNIIRSFRCHYNEVEVFSAELSTAIAANPLIVFFTVATSSGVLRFSWDGDQDFHHSETVDLHVG